MRGLADLGARSQHAGGRRRLLGGRPVASGVHVDPARSTRIPRADASTTCARDHTSAQSMDVARRLCWYAVITNSEHARGILTELLTIVRPGPPSAEPVGHALPQR